MRPSKTEYYLKIAEAVSQRSTCIRRQYGAVIVKNDEIVSTGYNGSVRGDVNCCDTGQCERERQGVKPGERYELCKSVHAEQNAIISAGREKTIGATLYLSGTEDGKRLIHCQPCAMCDRFIRNVGISSVESWGMEELK